MKIGVISDSHDHIANLKLAINILNKEKVGLVFFCGDLSSPFTLSVFQELKAPLKAVFGNNEGDKKTILDFLRENNSLKIEYAPKQGLMWNLTVLGKKIAVFHGHQQEITDNLINSGLFDFVFTGHTHNSQLKKTGKTLWLNPGSLCGWTGLEVKPTRPTLGLVNLKTNQAQILNLT